MSLIHKSRLSEEDWKILIMPFWAGARKRGAVTHPAWLANDGEINLLLGTRPTCEDARLFSSCPPVRRSYYDEANEATRVVMRMR